METWVAETLATLDDKYTYHDERHTRDVVRNVSELLAHYNMEAREEQLLLTAALFHDIAFVKTHLNHEAESAKMAACELPRFGFSEAEIERIQNMILATRIPQSPKNLSEEILCDADLYYLGSGHYEQIANRLKTEWQNIGVLQNDDDWHEMQLLFLKKHTYHTEYAKMYLQQGKEAVIEALETKAA